MITLKKIKFWARVDCKDWVGRFEVNTDGIIVFTPPIMYRWKGKKWVDFIREMVKNNSLIDFQIYQGEV